MRLSSLPTLALFDPGLGTHLHRVPWATHRRRVAEVEVVQVVDAHAVKEGSGKDINPFGDFPVPMTDDLRSQKATGLAITGDPHVQFMRTRVVDLVVPAR